MKFGVAGYTIIRDTEAEARKELQRVTNVNHSAAGYENFQQWLAGTQLDQALALEDYSGANRGLRSGLVGTPESEAEGRAACDAGRVGLGLRSGRPQYETMESWREGDMPVGSCAANGR